MKPIVRDIYESSTKDMAFSIGGEYDIRRIDRTSFILEAENIGLGKQIAMKHFDNLADRFAGALENACEYLIGQGFIQARSIKERIIAERRITG